MKIILSFLLSSIILQSVAQWEIGNEKSVPLGSETSVEINPVFTSDSKGNTYVAWTDFRNGSGELYVQKINKRGINLWTENGVKVGPVIEGNNYAFTPMSIVENDGGVHIVWQQMPNSSDTRSKILLKQEVSFDGNLILQSPEVIANSLFNETVVNAIITQGKDDSNVPFLVYNVLNGSSIIDRVFFRKNGQEKLLFTTAGDGSKVLDDKQNKRLVALVANGGSQFTALAFDYGGNSIGQSKTVISNPFAGNSRIDFITVDKGFTYLARTLTSDFQKRVIAQKLDKDFNRLWGEIGVELGSNTGFDMQLAPNQDGGATMAWIEPNSFERRMMSARVSAAGIVMWQKPVFNGKENVNYFAPNKFASDGNGGCYSLWFEAKGNGFNLHVQHMSPTGDQLWGSQGIRKTEFNWYSNYRLIPHIEGGVIALFSGSENSDINANNSYDLYTNYISSTGVFGIEQGIEAVLTKNIFCPTEIFNVGLPDNNYTGFLQYSRGIIELEKVDTLNNFRIPPNALGAYNLFFRDADQVATLTAGVTIVSPSVPILTASSDITCKETSEEIELASSCSVGTMSWSTGESSAQIKVNVTETTNYSVSCKLAGCPLEPTDDVTIEVVEIKVTASAPNSNFAGQNIQLTANANADNYVWNGPGGFTSTQQSPQILNAFVSDAGVYTVTVTDDLGCEGSAQVLVNISELLSIEEDNFTFNIYPNPSKQILKINSKEKFQKLFAINMIGYAQNLQFKGNDINIGILSPGIYLLKVEFESGKINYQKFVKY